MDTIYNTGHWKVQIEISAERALGVFEWVEAQEVVLGIKVYMLDAKWIPWAGNRLF